MKRSFAVLLTVLVLAAGPVTRAAPPNIVLIVADDLGFRELGSYGQEKIRTPHLDRLAAEGMRFTQAYAGSAVCAPSRCVIMTGKHPGHAAVRDNREADGGATEGQAPLPVGEVTVADALKGAGYATGAFGKWGLGPPGSTADPLERGFDRFFGYNCQRHAHSYYPSYLWSDRERVALDNDPPVPGHAGFPEGADPADPASYATFKGKDYAPDRIHAAALDFVREHREGPFFLYYPTVIPHVALHVPDEDLAPYLALGWEDPPFTRERGGYTPHFTPRAAYAAMISRMDRNIGRLLELLDELELADDTIVVFSSDNGTTHLRDEVDYEFFESVGDLRGLKGSLYEGGVRVPFIVRWPGHVAPGTTSDRVVGFEDVLPTLAEIAGVDVPAGVDGVSFVPTLRGEAQPPRTVLYREFHGYGGQQSVRFGDWKAVRQGIRRGSVAVELYDLAEDPSESTDVAAEHAEILARAEAFLRAERQPSELFPFPPLDDAPRTADLAIGSGPGWRALGEADFVNVNCDPDTWTWKDGGIQCTGSPIGVVRTNFLVTNVEIIVEWRHLKSAGNSGVFLWASPESIENLEQGKGRLPHGIEVQILDHGYTKAYEESTTKKADWFTTDGDVFPTGPARMTPFPPVSPNGQRSFPSKRVTKGTPEWNHYYIRAVNGEVRLWVNGEEVSGGTGCTPATGYLCLESEGSPIEFRNVRIRAVP